LITRVFADFDLLYNDVFDDSLAMPDDLIVLSFNLPDLLSRDRICA
jgi:hypothetical protein